MWVGNDDNTPLSGIHGGGLPAQIWRDFMAQANPAALRETAARLHEALDRALWKPRSNSAAMLLSQIKDASQ